jgi:hypothetical protein
MPSVSDYTIDGLGGVSVPNAINGQSALNSASTAVKMPSGGVINSCTMSIKGSAGISAGAVILEGSLDPVATAPGSVGNWFQLAAPITALASVAVPGFELAGPVPWVRGAYFNCNSRWYSFCRYVFIGRLNVT